MQSKPKSGLMRITVDYGYDIHSIQMSGLTLRRIQAGKPVQKMGQGFPVEGEFEQDWWSFNAGGPGTISVYTEEGRDIFTGALSDGEVWIDPLS